ncbi:retrovirus-related pol polyprotein from transposon TNT 1-94 [Tanacetum coccineum]
MVPKSKDWVERHNPDGKLLNFSTERILVSEIQVVNECLKPTKTSNDPESSKDSELESLTPLPPLKNLQGASPSSKRHIRKPIWYLDSRCSRSMTGVKRYLDKYVEQPGPKIVKCLHLLHMDLFGPVSLMFINHEKYTLVIVDEYLSIEDAKTILNGSVLSKHFWTEAVKIACYTRNRSIIVERHNKTPYEIFRERIPNICYFYVLRCLVFIHNYKDHLGKFYTKADDGYFLGYLFNSKSFRVFNTRRQQIEETYHVTFDESIEAIRFTNTLVDEIGIDDSSRYPPGEFLYEDDPSRQYQANSDISYYVIHHRRSLTELTKDKHVRKEIALNEKEIPHTEDDRWSSDQHIKLVNIIRGPGEGMLTRSMAAKLTTASDSECLFANFLSKIEPKKVSEALKRLGWVDVMQEELSQFYRNKV